MKLLSWMHHKVRQSNFEPFKDFAIGNCYTCLSAQPSPDEPPFYAKPSHSSKSLNQHESECHHSISELDAKRLEDLEELSVNTLPEFFHGFLAIGTLGSEPIINEPLTPTFGTTCENIFEKGTEVTENDLKLISDELEKFLEAEVKEEEYYESSGRNSYVSITTLSSKQTEGADAEEHAKMEVCPLQGYFFGSSIELPDSRIEAKKEKASLGELFQMTKMADEHSKREYGKGNRRDNGKDKSVLPLMKKMLRKLYAASENSKTSTGNDASQSASTKTKFNKVLRMFRRKIHPESSMAAKEFKKSHRDEINSTLYRGSYTNEDFLPQDEDDRRSSQGFMQKEGFQCENRFSNLLKNRLSSNSSNGNREHWIKTDADYLVLEL